MTTPAGSLPPPGDGRFEMVVGLEVHVQLRTRTKAFCRCATSFGDPPNRNTCPVCLGLPGALPVLNAHAVDLAVRAALALDCSVHARSEFARKNYFYPDLPKGYQISQFDRPLATDGAIALGAGRRIGITRVHMEEDAGKSVHDRFPGATAIDLNRAGVPLIEIVSEPDMRSAEEATQYLRALREILMFAGVSDCSMEEGSLRVDANVSARMRGTHALQTRTEIKNLNSFANTERALVIEFARHCARHAAGQSVHQETMLYDDRTDTVRPARSKEDSHDYRYFPDPDLPPLVLAPGFVEQARASLPELPAARRARWSHVGVASGDTLVLTSDRDIADYFDAVISAGAEPPAAAHWVLGEVLAARNGGAGAAAFVPAHDLAGLVALVRESAVSSTAAKTIYARMIDAPGAPRAIAQREGLLQVGDDTSLAGWIDDVLAAHPAEAARYLGGEARLHGVLVGLVMKQSRGRADPRKVGQLLSGRLAGK